MFTTPKGAVEALASTSFAVGQGEFVSIVGPSGCGKTTILRIIAGLTAASQGHVYLNGQEITGRTGGNIGIVFQEANLLPWRTILDNVALPLKVAHMPKPERHEQARHYIDLVGLKGFANRMPHELSGGMRQRAGIARALVHNPALMLLDEPFGALDAMTRDEHRLEFLRLWQETNKTVLFITHDIGEAVFMSDRVLVMTPRPGRVVQEVAIDLPRPRHLDQWATPAFREMVHHIRETVVNAARRQEGGAALEA
ncbi:MAG TPA: ABC transporter ATP-binding protein [Symbiobacteriaceae bacterium]|nr:ABC transporter ATP-binding protein [Symbiobacteriaceae bacterium]